MTPETPPPPFQPPGDNERASFTVAVVSLCFGALGAVWSFIGGACCGWAGWGWAFIGLVLAGVSLFLKKSALGWIALGTSGFAFLWVIIETFILSAGTASGIHSLFGNPPSR